MRAAPVYDGWVGWRWGGRTPARRPEARHATTGPVFLDESGRRLRRLRATAWSSGVTLAVFGAVLIAALVIGSLGVPAGWNLPFIPPAVVETSPSPSPSPQPGPDNQATRVDTVLAGPGATSSQVASSTRTGVRGTQSAGSATSGITQPGTVPAATSSRPTTAPGQTNRPTTAPGQTKQPTTAPGQTTKPTAPPGQTKKPTTAPGPAKAVAPGQTTKPTVPPGQTKQP